MATGNLSRLKLVSCAAKFPASSTVLSILCNVTPAQVPLPLLWPGSEGQLALLQPEHHQEGSLLPRVRGFIFKCTKCHSLPHDCHCILHINTIEHNIGNTNNGRLGHRGFLLDSSFLELELLEFGSHKCSPGHPPVPTPAPGQLLQWEERFKINL